MQYRERMGSVTEEAASGIIGQTHGWLSDEEEEGKEEGGGRKRRGRYKRQKVRSVKEIHAQVFTASSYEF